MILCNFVAVKKITLYIAILLMSSLFSLVHGQCVDAIAGHVSVDDSTRCVGESSILTLTGSTGSITWLYRDLSSVTWNLLVGETDSVAIVTTNINRQYIAILTGSCTDSSNIVTIRVSTFPEVPSIGFGGSECGLKAYPSAVSSGKPLEYWTMDAGAGNAVFYPNIYASIPDSVVVDVHGDYQFAWNISENYCTKSASVAYIFNEIPVANAGFDTNHCTGIFNMNAMPSINGSTGQWTKISSGTFNFITSGTPNTLVNANPGDYQIKWRETYNGCSDEDTVRVRVAIQPVAVAGSGGSECDKNIILNASPSIYFGNWSFVSGPGDVVFANSNSNNALAKTTAYGENYILQWKLVNSFCSDSSTVSVNFYEQPISNAGLSPDICGDTAILSAVSSIGDGTWKHYLGPTTTEFFDNTLPETWANNKHVPGEYSLIWSEANNVCVDSDTITFTYFEQPVSFAGLADTTCGQNSALNASPSAGIGSWKPIQGPGSTTITNISLASSPVSITNYGVYTFRWKEVNEICSDSSDVSLSFFQQPIAKAGLGGDTCGLSFRLNAVWDITGSKGTWLANTDFFDGKFSDSLSASTVVSVSEPETYGFAWIEDFNSCIDTDYVSVTFNELPLSDPGIGGEVCGNTFSMNATDFGVSGKWTSSKPAGVFTPSNASPAARVAVNDTGLYRFNWSVDNGICSSDSSITVHFYEQPITSILQQGFDNCGESTQLSATLSTGSGTWSQLSGRGVANFTNRNSASTRVSVSEYDKYTLQWLGENGACSDSNSIAIDFIEQPFSNAGTNDIICGNTYQLNASDVQFNGEWFLSEGAGIASYSPNNTFAQARVEVNEMGNYTFMRKVKNGICEDTSSVSIQFVESPAVDAGVDQELNNVFETNLNASNLGEGQSGLWTLISGDGSISESSSPATSISNLSIGEALFSWKVSNGNCANTDTLKVTVYDIFIPSVITPNNDSENDYFVIQGIDDIDGVELTVVNRWGIEVYFSSDYQNDWDGISKSGTELTNDTYFYVVKIDNSRIIKGFVVIKR